MCMGLGLYIYIFVYIYIRIFDIYIYVYVRERERDQASEGVSACVFACVCVNVYSNVHTFIFVHTYQKETYVCWHVKQIFIRMVFGCIVHVNIRKCSCLYSYRTHSGVVIPKQSQQHGDMYWRIKKIDRTIIVFACIVYEHFHQFPCLYVYRIHRLRHIQTDQTAL